MLSRFSNSLADLPQLLVHSDLHVDHGPFTLPIPVSVNDRPTIAVFAGDTGDGINVDAMKTLRSLSNLQTVAVAGNHDFWGVDYFEQLKNIRASAKEHGIYFLENDSVTLHGVRFIGATLWTDYCGGDPTLMHYGLWHMRDHEFIKASSWWTIKNKAKFLQTFGQHALSKFEGHFNPLMQMELHQKSKAFLAKMASQEHDGPTVVLTHHAPSQESLKRAGVNEDSLNPEYWSIRRNDDLGLTRVGSYANRLLEDKVLSPGKNAEEDKKYQRAWHVSDLHVTLWAHGHLHNAMDYGYRGVRVVCNPRGRVHPPLTEESARAFALLGYGVSKEQIAESQKRYKENPELGDGHEYKKSNVIDLNDSCQHWVEYEYQTLISFVEKTQEETQGLVLVSQSSREQVAHLAGLRVDTLRARVIQNTNTFFNFLLAQHQKHYRGNLAMWVMLGEAGGPGEYTNFMPDNVVSYENMVAWRDRDNKSEFFREVSPSDHAKGFRDELRKLMSYLEKVPEMSRKLRSEHLQL